MGWPPVLLPSLLQLPGGGAGGGLSSRRGIGSPARSILTDVRAGDVAILETLQSAPFDQFAKEAFAVGPSSLIPQGSVDGPLQ